MCILLRGRAPYINPNATLISSVDLIKDLEHAVKPDPTQKFSNFKLGNAFSCQYLGTESDNSQDPRLIILHRMMR